MVDITILNVNADETSRTATADLLRREGFGVIAAETGLEALGVARSAQPQLVVLNLSLPDLSGKEVVRRLKEDVLTSTIPILQTSPSPETEADFVSGAVRTSA